MNTNVIPLNPETKEVHFEVKSHEQKQDANGIPIGIVRGIASTFDDSPDRDEDIVASGAFDQTIKDLKSRGRDVRMLFQHWSENIIGKFPINNIEINSRGLMVEGQINLDVQKGREIYSLIKQGALSDFSIGFQVLDQEFKNGIRIINNLELFEISVVTEPANMNARITEVKRAVPFQDFALADQAREWDSSAANGRWRAFTNSEDAPTARYKEGFLFYDAENADQFGSYKLQIVDIIDGEPKAVPRAIFAVASVLQGGRGGVDLPDADRPAIERNVNRYYDKLGLESPLEKTNNDKSRVLTLDDVVDINTIREFETVLKTAKHGFSRKAAKHLAALAKSHQWDADTDKKSEDCDDLKIVYGADFYMEFSKKHSH